jgi:hypothetical protein
VVEGAALNPEKCWHCTPTDDAGAWKLPAFQEYRAVTSPELLARFAKAMRPSPCSRPRSAPTAAAAICAVTPEALSISKPVPQLLFEPYTPPALRVGDRATCLFRDADVVVTSWTDALIPWPRCRALDTRDGSGLLVDAELARAVRHESGRAVMHWWGVCRSAVWKWRQALGVPGSAGTEGSRQLIRAAALTACGARRTKHLQPGYVGPRWTKAELRLLGKLADEDLAVQLGRSVEAVRRMRNRRGIAAGA